MTEAVTQKTYEIDRVEASKILKVSTRTIDRYLRLKKLSAIKSRGRILLSKQELLDVKKGTPYTPAPEPQKPLRPRSHDTQFYKDLYDETLKVLEEKTARLEQAQYRIGQLESQSSISLSAHSLNPSPEEFHSLQILRQNLAEQEKALRVSQNKLEREKFNRRVITIVLYVLLFLQPVLWYLLRTH